MTPETIDGGKVDQRYYLSLLTLGATLVVAWVLSQLYQDPPTSTPPAPSENSIPSELTSGAGDAGQIEARSSKSRQSLVVADAEPLIPGLLDDSEQPTTAGPPVLDPGQSISANSNSGSMLERPSPTAAPPSQGLNGVPLRRISSGPIDTTPSTEKADLSKITQDSSSPRLRPLPVFSMPNSQTRSTANFENPGQTNAPNQPIGTQNSAPSSTILRPLGSDEYRALETQTSEPHPLPGERHVLRPIIRSQAPLSSTEPRSESPPTPDSIWDTPMPGLKRRNTMPDGQGSGGLSVPNPATGVASAPPTFGDPALATSGDPLFVPVGSNAGPNGGNLNRDLPATSPLSRPDFPIGPTRPTTTPRSAGRPRPPSSDYIWHVIQQNQSLESISFQYHGDGNLVPRILELNRDLLTDPQLLPIGKAIRVPIR